MVKIAWILWVVFSSLSTAADNVPAPTDPCLPMRQKYCSARNSASNDSCLLVVIGEIDTNCLDKIQKLTEPKVFFQAACAKDLAYYFPNVLLKDGAGVRCLFQVRSFLEKSCKKSIETLR